MDKEEIYQEILKRSQNGRISCRQCFEIARECDISLKVIGEACNEKSIKVHACQLGLFK
jgi:hypothetical protein